MAWKKNNQTFSALAMYDFSGPGLNLGQGDHPEQVKAIHVTSEYFAVFGVTPVPTDAPSSHKRTCRRP